MAKKWAEVANSAEYQALPDADKEAARAQYFDQVVAPQVAGSDINQARAQFNAQTAPRASDVPLASGRQRYTEEDLSPEAMAPERPKSFSETAGDFANDLGRNAAMQVGSLVKGAAGVPDVVIAPAAGFLDRGAQALGASPKYFSGGDQGLRGYVQSGLDAAGVPQPANATERFANRVMEGLGGSVGGVGFGRALVGSENALVSGIGQSMASNPVAQGVGAVTSAAGAQAAQESGLGPWGELAGGLAGGLAPALPAGLSGLTRGALRGGEAGRQKVAQSIADFDSAGTTPDIGQATGSKTNQLLGAALSRTPGAAGVMARRADAQAGEIQGGVEGLASKLSPNADPAKAGLTIERGITGEGGFVDRFKAKSGELYDQLDKFLPQGTRVGTSNTAQALDELTAPIPEARNLSERFIPGEIKSIKGAFDEDTRGPMAALNRPDIVSEVQRRQFAAADQNAAIDRTNELRQSLGLKPKSNVDPNEDIASLLDQASDGRLPYEALKKLRTEVGERASQPNLVSDVKSSAWKRLYAGISADMEAAANQAGPEAAQAWNRANGYYKAGTGRIEALDRIVDKAGGPEAVFNAATSGTKDGAFTIRNVMQSLQPDQQKVLSATVIRRLGQATPGTATEQGEFSINSFLTNWNKLSPAAKGVLFDRFGSTFRDDIDAISRTAGGFRQAAKTGANPSGTAGALSNQQALGGFAIAAMTGHPLVAGGIAGAAGAANIGARAFTSPTVVRWLAKTTNTPRSQWPGVIAGLAQMARQNNDPVATQVADTLRQQLQQSNNDRDDGRGKE